MHRLINGVYCHLVEDAPGDKWRLLGEEALKKMSALVDSGLVH
jgi:hypothetical protein